ncbi:MAG: hypothetical protein IJ736_06640, partial [Firmicutes bacterium]|nr:hypothetical protein [Bacillota bacterium]
MKGIFKKVISAAVSVSMLFTACVSAQNVFADDTAKKIYIVGDSTACIYGKDDKYAIPRGGWGMYFQDFLKDGPEVIDLALSGRSSKSFTSEEEYQKLKDELGSGDYLIIQFGHNDQKKSSDEDLEKRYTDPEGGKDDEGSFKNSLYTNYIKLAQDKGAKPIILTPVTRRSFDEKGKIKDVHGLYDDAVRELASE